MSAQLQYVLLLQRNVPRAAKYYSEGIGLQLNLLTESWAELQAGATIIALKHTERCGDARCGDAMRTSDTCSPVSQMQDTSRCGSLRAL
jgi:catechol-2,3-dioxygenase